MRFKVGNNMVKTEPQKADSFIRLFIYIIS